MLAGAGCALGGLDARMVGSACGKPMTGRIEEVEGRSMFMTVYCRRVFNLALENCSGITGVGKSICVSSVLPVPVLFVL